MVYKGQVKGGVIVIESDEPLPEGAEVTIEVRVTPPPATPTPFAQSLLELAGTVEGLPSDAALNLDHYLYGLPKR